MAPRSRSDDAVTSLLLWDLAQRGRHDAPRLGSLSLAGWSGFAGDRSSSNKFGASGVSDGSQLWHYMRLLCRQRYPGCRRGADHTIAVLAANRPPPPRETSTSQFVVKGRQRISIVFTSLDETCSNGAVTSRCY